MNIKQNNTAIKICNTSNTIKGNKIIDILSFSVKRGKIFGFLGPSGAGKTTI